MKGIRYLLTQLFFRIIPPVVIEREINKAHLQWFKKYATLSEGVVLSQYSLIHNKTQDKSRISIGRETLIDGELLVDKEGNITMGAYCYVGKGSRIWSSNSVSIGDHVFISHNVNIMDTNAHSLSYQKRAEARVEGKEETDILTDPVCIKDHAWIGFNSIILKGVTIGRGAIVSAGSIVTKDVPDFTMVGGPRATEIKRLS